MAPPLSAQLIVAHRGAPTERPENTLAAFGAALDAGARAVEFDVRVTADGQAVVIHDAALDRTTDGAGLIRDHTLAEVHASRISGGDGRTYAVPTLHETLALLSGRAGVDVAPFDLTFPFNGNRWFTGAAPELDLVGTGVRCENSSARWYGTKTKL